MGGATTAEGLPITNLGLGPGLKNRADSFPKKGVARVYGRIGDPANQSGEAISPFATA